MPLRKTRVACQGISNQTQVNFGSNTTIDKTKTQSKSKTLDAKLSKTLNNNNLESKYQTPKLDFTTQNYFTKCQSQGLSHSSSSANLSQSQFNNNTQSSKYKQLLFSKSKFLPSNSQQASKTLSPQLDNVLTKIRSTYKSNPNVRRIIKAWGFQNKGCISDQKFTQMVEKYFNPTFTTQDCQELMSNFSSQHKNLDLLTFIKLVFDQEPFTKPNIRVLNENKSGNPNDGPTTTLINKIQDLNEASLFKRVDQNGKKKVVLPHLKKKTMLQQQNTNVSSSFVMERSENLQKTQPSLHQTMHYVSSPKFNYSTTKSHCVDFTPTMFYGKNQQKTRFNATPLIQLNDQSLSDHKREKIVDQTFKVVNQLQNHRNEQKVRYENKLQKIRVYQQRQKQNVIQIDQKYQARDQANLKRWREENMAYNYVNFIHNDWK